MNGYRLSQFVALMIVAVMMSPRLLVAGAEEVIELSAGCTLYDAIIAANSDSASGACPAGRGADTIRLTGDITLEDELPLIVSTISIEGDGYSISGDDAFRIFRNRLRPVESSPSNLTSCSRGARQARRRYFESRHCHYNR